MKQVLTHGSTKVVIEPRRTKIQLMNTTIESVNKAMAADFVQDLKIQLAMAGTEARCQTKFYKNKMVFTLVFKDIESQNTFTEYFND